jgi:mono/diheme cytochrome c family protein
MKNNVFSLLCLAGVLVVTTFFLTIQNYEPWVAPPEADNLKNPLGENAKVTSKSENRFNFTCERCHGNHGKGDGIDGKKLNPRPADLTSEKVQKQSDGAIFWKISNGRGQMLGYKNTFDEKEIWQLVNYIRDLGKHKDEVAFYKGMP